MPNVRVAALSKEQRTLMERLVRARVDAARAWFKAKASEQSCPLKPLAPNQYASWSLQAKEVAGMKEVALSDAEKAKVVEAFETIATLSAKADNRIASWKAPTPEVSADELASVELALASLLEDKLIALHFANPGDQAALESLLPTHDEVVEVVGKIAKRAKLTAAVVEKPVLV